VQAAPVSTKESKTNPALGAGNLKGKTMKTSFKYAALAASALLWATSLILAGDDRAKSECSGPERPDICQPHPFYGEQAACWWQAVWALPPAYNPVFDQSGTNSGIGQSGPIWFLHGTFGGAAVRSNSVPADRSLFFPVVDTAWINAPAYGDPPWNEPYTDTSVNPPKTYKSFGHYKRLQLKADMDVSAETATCEVDGKKVKGVRTQSPDFSVWICDEIAALMGIAGGVYGPCVTDGVWVLVPPLSPGQHTIHIKAGTFVDVTYKLTVVPVLGKGH
jgi:hypothetical protein